MNRGSAARTIAGALLLGVALGVFSFVGDLLTGDSPEIVLNALANAFGPWVVIAFVAGIRDVAVEDVAARDVSECRHLFVDGRIYSMFPKVNNV